MSAPRDPAARALAPLVIKFGGAALASPVRVRAAVARIRYHREREGPTVAVVSAPGATTDRILDRVSRVAGATPPPGLERAVRRERDRALATGEDRSASVLAAALLGAGIPARSVRGDEAGVQVAEAEGGEPRDPGVDPAPIGALLAAGVVPVVSGFQARGADGELVTLARGGSDLTAVVLAEALGSPRCLLVKDVPGIFDRDPHRDPGALFRETLTWDDLVALARAGGQVVQLEAAERARRACLPLRVVHYASRPGGRGGTWIGTGAGVEGGIGDRPGGRPGGRPVDRPGGQGARTLRGAS